LIIPTDLEAVDAHSQTPFLTFKSLLRVFRNFLSADRLLEGGSSRVWSGLFVLGEEIAIEFHYGDVSLPA